MGIFQRTERRGIRLGVIFCVQQDASMGSCSNELGQCNGAFVWKIPPLAAKSAVSIFSHKRNRAGITPLQLEMLLADFFF